MTVTKTKTRTVTGATYIPTNIFNAISKIVDKKIPKSYKLDKIFSSVKLDPFVKTLLQGNDSTYGNVTFFASVNEGIIFHSRQKISSRADQRTSGQIPTATLRYDIVSTFLDPSSLPLKVLAPTILLDLLTSNGVVRIPGG